VTDPHLFLDEHARLRDHDAMRLLEREVPLEAIAAAIGRAERGSGSIVLIEGPAGIGKSAVLAAARKPRPRWLRARGGELERDLPLGVTRQLLEPVLADADAATRARLLEGTSPAAAALEGQLADGDAAALLHGLYRLVRNLSAQDPLVLEVDDVQWADAASLRFVAFLARRADELPVVLLLARRIGERAMDERALDAIAAEPVIERRALEPLSGEAVARMIAERSGGPADERFTEACRLASAGNPFVLRELLHVLREAGVSFDAEGARRVDEAGPPVVAQWVLRRLEQLPPGAAGLARAVAVLGPHADLGRAARLAGLRLEDAGLLLDALIAQDLLVAGRPLEFVHPVVRAAIHDAMRPGERSIIHRAAARLLHDQQAAPDAVAMHLLATQPGGERWVAEALLEGAEMALGQGAPEIAAAHVQRALAEPAPPQLRPKLLHALGNAERRLGTATADERFLAAYADTADLRERARILLDMVITGGPQNDVLPLMRATMEELGPIDPDLALILRARMLVAIESSSQPLEPEIRAAETALARYSGETLGARLLAGALAFHIALRAEPRHEVIALGVRAIGDDRAYLTDLDDGYPHIFGIAGLVAVDAFELPMRRLEHAIARARERGSLIGAAIGLFWRAVAYRLAGQLTESRDDGKSALEFASRTSDEWLVATSCSALIETLVEQGQLGAAEELLDEHRDLAERLPPGPPLANLTLARCALALASGRASDAYGDARDAARIAEALDARNPILSPWRARASLALIALGRAPEARPIAEEALRIAEAAELPAAIGEARRILAAAAGGEEAITLLGSAVAILESTPVPLELARALIDLGAALRRAGRRREAREPLSRGLELAHRHGAHPLIAAARTELRAAGARPRREVRTGLDALTPSERRVADLAAAGLTNAEIAARLFITVKTTEHHLAAIYRKLGIASRRELPAQLDSAQAMGQKPRHIA
jgi:DNA-binding CsgD family transcriptional regulator